MLRIFVFSAFLLFGSVANANGNLRNGSLHPVNALLLQMATSKGGGAICPLPQNSEVKDCCHSPLTAKCIPIPKPKKVDITSQKNQ